MNFFYVYSLQSETDKSRFYSGFTEDLKARLQKHNEGGVPHTAKFRPWRIKTAIAFSQRERALEFERYLKSASGRAFAKKHF
ncbi:MAG TPA: GIY-YIG nuclease family protein [Verrucomicrobiae bacterium]|nr:GIY-YIG nuclease family protein [Verrucomicrobiae bacterium]